MTYYLSLTDAANLPDGPLRREVMAAHNACLNVWAMWGWRSAYWGAVERWHWWRAGWIAAGGIRRRANPMLREIEAYQKERGWKQ